MNPYIGHSSQLFGIEEHRLVGGKGDGIRLLELFNGAGLEATVSLDRNADLSRLRYKGVNLGYFSPCGYVGPSYYQDTGGNFLKSFTAGFLTTCGLESVGTPCEDEGISYPLHGSIANTPTCHSAWFEEDNHLVIQSVTSDETMFGRKLCLHRVWSFPIGENTFTLTDTVENTGERTEPFEILYHLNMGYPLLDEDSVIHIASGNVVGRNELAQRDIQNWAKMEKPTAGYEELCYYHTMDEVGYASIYQPKNRIKLEMQYDAKDLDCFTEWKMMGIRDYVLGLECGNCYPDGRNIMREKGILKFLEPGECKTYCITFRITEE